ncbi:type VI secretion system baseplate subunit TssF [Alsobacter sp. KACC 23698]|uniref:Type VI secretion system baseplate subunit TssF n=1 Tax=Alsobacter sp. KACC 23698 TaxID=3149229 RepID=A0AAU7JNB7_9HYPH
MDREFLDLYNRELELLYEHAAEFSEEYPGIAGRLGGILRDRTDPMVAGLLEGSAFLAARVQLKIKHEFPEFTNNLLEQLVPHFLAPTPSAMLVAVAPPYGDPALREGRTIPRRSALDAAYVELERRVSCRFRTTAPVTLWPFELTGAEYFSSPSAAQAAGVPGGRGVIAGLRLSLTVRTTGRVEDEASAAEAATRPDHWFAGCGARELPIYLTGPEPDCDALCEQMLGHCRGVWFRYADAFGNPVVAPAPAGSLDSVGFDEADSLLPTDNRVFRGFDLLNEFFVFPRKFLGFTLGKLDEVLCRLPVRQVDVIFGFDEVNARLSAAVQPDMFALYAAPAVNLFEMTTDRIPVKASQYEFQVVPDRSRYLDFEPHRILDVYAHYAGGSEKAPVRPLYSPASDGRSAGELCYTLRRLPRRRTGEERKYGATSNYVGSDMFISIGEPAFMHDRASVAELSVRALCSNRHLTEHMPVSQGQADFHLADDITLQVKCVAGPTPPREPVASHLRSRTENAHTGVVVWRLINMLALNHLGLVEHGAGKNAQALREILSMFADVADSAVERRIRGIKLVESRPVVRRLRQKGGIGPARGAEISVTIDDKAFEGSGAFLLGCVLERFYSDYAAFNHFTQLVLRTVERGEIMRWPARIGSRRPL